MFGRIKPEAYDCEGRKTLLPKKKSSRFRPTSAMGGFVACKLSVHCESLEEMRAFLRGCRYRTDQEQFGVRDHWMAPDEFEKARAGDCEDYALWAWRQLLEMGYEARFVLGDIGYGRRFHAWVTYREGDGHMLVEPVAARYRRLSRLSVLLHEPEVSVGWEDGRLVYREHQKRDYRPGLGESLAIAAEWLPIALGRKAIASVEGPWRFLRAGARRRGSLSRPRSNR